MTKSKMAVRTKQRKQPLNFNFSLVAKTKSILRVVVLFVAFISFGYLFSSSKSLFETIWPVAEIVLQGENKFVKHHDIKAFMDKQKVQGMLAIDLQQLQLNTKQLNWVKNVEIRKVWPNQLVFKIKEHQPVAWFGEMVLTQQGTLIKSQESQAGLNALPRINKEVEIRTNKNIAVIGAHEAVKVWKEFKQIKRNFELINLQLEGVKIDEVNNWRLLFSNNLKVNLGRNKHLKRALRLVKIFPIIKNKQTIKNIDLRYHNGLAVEWNQINHPLKKELQQKG